MSSQDVLVVAEIQRGMLVDVTGELLAAGAGDYRGGRARSWRWCSATRGGLRARKLGAAGPHRAGRRSAVGRICAGRLRGPGGGRGDGKAQGRADRGDFDRLGRGAHAGRATRRAAGDRLQGRAGRRRRAGRDGLLLRAARWSPRWRFPPRRPCSCCCPGSVRPTGESGKPGRDRALSAPLEAGAVQAEEYILPEAGDVDITSKKCSWRGPRHPAEREPGGGRRTGPGPGRRRLRLRPSSTKAGCRPRARWASRG